MAWVQCECGKRLPAANQNSARVQLCKCRAKHVKEENLQLGTQELRITSIWFCILTHADCSLYKQTVEDLVNLGVSKDKIIVSTSVSPGAKHGDRPLRDNELCHYGVKYRLFNKLHEKLQCDRTPAAVIFCESNTNFDVDWRSFLQEVKEHMENKPVLWMGYRKKQCPGLYAQRTNNKIVIMGAKCIVCVRHGLKLLWKAINHTGKLGHYDLVLSTYLSMRHIYVPEKPRVGYRKHLSRFQVKGKRTWRAP